MYIIDNQIFFHRNFVPLLSRQFYKNAHNSLIFNKLQAPS